MGEKVAIYCRLSDEDRDKVSAFDESESIQNQKSLLTKYAIEKDWAIYKIYSDDDYSGLDSERPEFNQMLKDAEEGKFNIVLCKHQSRFTRDIELVEKYLHNKFLIWGIRFVSITDNVDTLEKGNKKSRQINGLINEWYCEDISEAIKATFEDKQEKGKFIGSFARYGYKKDPKDKNRLIIDEEAANLVRRIYSWYISGHGTQHIAAMLNQEEVPNPSKYKKLSGSSYKNSNETNDYGLWNKTTVKRILCDEMYMGNMVQGTRKKLSYKSKKISSVPKDQWKIVKGTHEPIIDEETFVKTQGIISGRKRSDGTGKAHVFATKVKCMDCHSNMNKASTTDKRRGKRYVYFRCKMYAVAPGKGLCTSHYIRLDTLQEIITEEIRKYINSLCSSDNLAQKLQHEEDLNNRVKQIESELTKVKRAIEEKTHVIKNLYIDKVRGIITEEQFQEFNRLFTEEKERLEKRQQFLESEILKMVEKSNSIDKWVEIVKRYKDFEELSHTMVSELIDYIEVGEEDKETKEQKIKIHWLF